MLAQPWTFFAATLAIAAFAGDQAQPLLGVEAHMALFDPSVYGFNGKGDLQIPLSNKTMSEWWFHGYASDKPASVMQLQAGSSKTVQISCNKVFTTYGPKTSKEACPDNAGAYHAGGTTGSQTGFVTNSVDKLTGCALAIAYKKDALSTKPEDFIVFSTQADCVHQRDTTFQIPDNMPSCPDGECTCAWFWQGSTSYLEMYMTGFRCNVVGGTNGPIPIPAKPRKLAIAGPTQPMYWANDNSNLVDKTGYDAKPTYNTKWGWKDGAQTSAFSGAGTSNATVADAAATSGNSTSTTNATVAASAATGTAVPATNATDNASTTTPAADTASSDTTAATPADSGSSASGTPGTTKGGKRRHHKKCRRHHKR